MKKLSDIIENILDGEKPTYEELYYTALTLRALHYFDHSALLSLAENPKKFFGLDYQAEESFRRFKDALGADPKVYVGQYNDPTSSQYQERREAGLKFLDKFLE